MASIYGGILSLRIANLVGQTNGQITVAQMNQLTNPETASNLPQNLIPEMRRILFESLHSIMLIGFFLIVAATIINVIRKEPLKQIR